MLNIGSICYYNRPFYEKFSDVNLSGCGKAGGRHRGGRGHDGLTGATVKVRKGPYKSCHGRVIEVKGSFVRIELESQMKVVTGKSCNFGQIPELPVSLYSHVL